MVKIDEALKSYLQNELKSVKIDGCYTKKWQKNRYICIATSIEDEFEMLHYECLFENEKIVIEFHLEGKFQQQEYIDFRKELIEKTRSYKSLEWIDWQGHSKCRCRLKEPADNYVSILNSIENIKKIFDGVLNELDKKEKLQTIEPASSNAFKDISLDTDAVHLELCSLGQLFNTPLAIPNYQRDYCWEEKQILALWDSLKEMKSFGCHLGTIILQKTKEKYDVIDGQQRLITLTLIMQSLKYPGNNLPLLKQPLISSGSIDHVAHTKWLIEKLVKNEYNKKDFGERIRDHLFFSVLVLKNERLDLAYTFFSNENTKGIPLSDYDLLKAHHLRFISNEKQSEHIANRWNGLIENNYQDLEYVLSTHLYRLRKWMRKKECCLDAKYRTKEEFSAAAFISDIPPFGEKFDFYEKIQGGTHFFAYAEFFVEKYRHFRTLQQYKCLWKHLQYESHWKYASVIESLLFAYFIKFGEQYLTESLFCIANNIAQHRYNNKHVLMQKILGFASESEIVMMIDQATSPTFFLAECLSATKGTNQNLDGIQFRFYRCLGDMFKELSFYFTDDIVKEKFEYEF